MKKYLPALFALSAPVIFVFGVVLYVVFFTSPVFPEYDFIMSNNRYSYVFSVENNRIKIDEERVEDLKENYRNFYPELELWYYSIKEDSFKRIDIEEAEELVLDKSKESPDGFEVEYVYSYGIDIFGFNSQRGYYIRKENKGRKLDIDDHGMSFIGWVIR